MKNNHAQSRQMFNKFINFSNKKPLNIIPTAVTRFNKPAKSSFKTLNYWQGSCGNQQPAPFHRHETVVLSGIASHRLGGKHINIRKRKIHFFIYSLVIVSSNFSIHS